MRFSLPTGCPLRLGRPGGSPRCLLGGSEGCRCWRASKLLPRTGFGAKCVYARCRCSIAARFSLRGRSPVYSLLSTARSRAFQIAVSVRSPNSNAALAHDPPKFSIQSSLETTERSRMRSRKPPDPRPIPEDVREPIYIRKKQIIWTRWRPVPVKNVNFSRALGIVIAVSLDPILPHQ